MIFNPNHSMIQRAWKCWKEHSGTSVPSTPSPPSHLKYKFFIKNKIFFCCFLLFFVVFPSFLPYFCMPEVIDPPLQPQDEVVGSEIHTQSVSFYSFCYCECRVKNRSLSLFIEDQFASDSYICATSLQDIQNVKIILFYPKEEGFSAEWEILGCCKYPVQG